LHALCPTRNLIAVQPYKRVTFGYKITDQGDVGLKHYSIQSITDQAKLELKHITFQLQAA